MASSSPDSKDRPPAQHRSTLLALPNEITDLIYSFYLPQGDLNITLKSTKDGSDRLDPSNWNTRISLSALAPVERPDVISRARREIGQSSISLLLVCHQVSAQATRILYSQNSFQYGVQVAQIQPVEYAIVMLGRLGLEARDRWIRTLHICRLELKRIWTLDLGPEGVGMLQGLARLFESMKTFCEVVRGMKGLRELGVGISVPNLDGWKGRVDRVRAIKPLIELAGPSGTKANIAVWWAERPRRFGEARDGKEEMFVRKVVEAMEEERTLVDGMVGKGLGIQYLERSVDGLKNGLVRYA